MTIYGHSTARVQANVSPKRFFWTPTALMCRVAGDGLRHFAYQKEQKFYNGVTLEQIHSESTVNGIQGR